MMTLSVMNAFTNTCCMDKLELTGQNLGQGILKGKYHCTIDLLFDWVGMSCMTIDNFCFIYRRDYSKRVRQEVNGTMILPSLVFPALASFSTLEDAVFMVST
jgi:hypothetical protein